MAQRLATEYVKTCLHLTEAEMSKFMDFLAAHQVNPKVKVTENGSQEVVFQDEAGQEVSLSFERKHGAYICQGSCRLSNPKLANLMRKAVAQFKGDAIVNRIYAAYTMKYVYKQGSVVQITEITPDRQKVVYEYKDTLGQLEQLFQQKHVEHEIMRVHAQINDLLDERNRSVAADVKRNIDEQLKKLTQKLFVLEA